MPLQTQILVGNEGRQGKCDLRTMESNLNLTSKRKSLGTLKQETNFVYALEYFSSRDGLERLLPRSIDLLARKSLGKS